jgi:hypothetical protein
MILQRAMDHVERARALMQTGERSDMTHCALETRMAIEELFYALIPQYRDELPSDILKRWQPKQIIDALLECNPMVEQYQQIRIGGDGGAAPLFVGDHTPATRELLRKYYHKLGSYLHAPIDGNERNLPRMQQFLQAALTRIEQNCRETTVISNVGIFFEHTCVCGRTIKRNLFALGVRPYAQCPDEDCKATYDIKVIVGGSIWTMRTVDFSCSRCRVKTPIGVQYLREDKRFTCIGCSSKYRVRIGPIAELQTAPPPSGSDGV